ncbi:MAG: N-glycosylase/DNA lyase, partial [Chloroflexi bacterium]|nr:N-glycosylase/DNA lyase [Chloroflexota bacterium]
YSRERLAQDKLNRLERFVRSNLCHEIWTSSPSTIATEFGQIWISLGHTMNQRPTKKTIAFSMKCLAYALHMVDETDFDFGGIPVPVDSRILMVSDRLGLPSGDDSTHRERWRQALELIQKSHPEVTMVHLDSLLWQIGALSPREMEIHLEKLGAGDLASRISGLFRSVE